jgi:hypothetical protein
MGRNIYQRLNFEPHVGDFDGNGTGDLAVYRPSSREFFVRGESSSRAAGHTSDFLPVCGDYDGDGITEFGIFGELPQVNGTLWVIIDVINRGIIPMDVDAIPAWHWPARW